MGEPKKLSFCSGLDVFWDGVSLEFRIGSYRDDFTLKRFFEDMGITKEDAERAFLSDTLEEETSAIDKSE